MLEAYRPLTQLLISAGEVRGRKKLQKMVFIAQTLGYPFQDTFHLHVWGPYSEVLAVRLREMVDWGFALEQVLPGPAGNSHYVYTPGEKARVVAGEPDPRLCGLMQHLNSQDATLLEGVATALYLDAEGYDRASATEALSRLKPDKFGDPAKVEAVLQFVRDLQNI